MPSKQKLNLRGNNTKKQSNKNLKIQLGEAQQRESEMKVIVNKLEHQKNSGKRQNVKREKSYHPCQLS